ncbi:MAG: Zn-ribbon domain-containing OB-fold protein, partial [Burkholderiaceae bacterium]
MSMPMPPPKRKNPALRTRPMHPPPAARSRIGLGLTAAAARGELALQVCQACGAHQYPPRESCCRCPSTHLKWQAQSGLGQLLAITTLSHSNDLFFR